MEYKIKKAHGDGQNEFDSVIEISGLSSEITINGLLDHLENAQKVLKEQTGQIEANKMLIGEAKNILPMLADIPEDKYHVAFSFFAKLSANIQAQATIETCKSTIETYTNHLKNIEEQTGIKCLPSVSPYQPVEIKYNKADGEGNN